MPLVFLLYALFSSVFIICKTALQYTEPLFLVGSRMLVAGILILTYHYFFNRSSFAFDKKCIFRLICLAFFNIYLTNACEVWGLQYLSSSKTCFIYSLSPFASALFSYFLFSETMTTKRWLGLSIGFIGFIPIMLDKSIAQAPMENFFLFSWAPELAVCIAAISSVYGWIILKQVVKDNQISFLMANGMSMLLGGAMALMHSFFIENWEPFPVTSYLPFLECSLLLLIISNFVCYNLYGFLLKNYTATFLSFAGFTTPLFTAILGWIFFGETVALPFYLSMFIVFSGLFLFYQEELRGGYVVKTEPTPEAV